MPDLFFDSGPTADWTPPASIGARRIPIVAIKWIGNTTPDGRHIDISAVIEFVRGELAKNPGTVYFALNDVEGILEEIYSHTALNNDPHPNWAQVVKVHVELLDALHAAFPSVLFAYWNRPNLPPFVDPRPGFASRWDRLSNENMERYTAGYLRAYEPIMRASGWLCPGKVYDDYEDGHKVKDANGNDTAVNSADALTYWGGDHAGAVAASALNCVAFCRAHFPDKPCIPFVNAYYLLPAYSTVFRAIDPDVLIARQVEPCLRAGAAGICVYSGIEWSLERACTSIDKLYDPQREWFEAVYIPDAWLPLDWQHNITFAYLADRIESHTLAALSAVRTAIDAATLKPVEPNALIETDIEETPPVVDPPEPEPVVIVPNQTPGDYVDPLVDLESRVAQLERFARAVTLGAVGVANRIAEVAPDFYNAPTPGDANA